MENPIFIQVPQVTIAQVSAADASLTAPTAPPTLFTAGASGSQVDKITVEATATTTRGMIRIWTSSDAGSTFQLIKEIDVLPVTPSATNKAFRAEWANEDGSPLISLNTAWLLYASTENAETFNVIAQGGDY